MRNAVCGCCELGWKLWRDHNMDFGVEELAGF